MLDTIDEEPQKIASEVRKQVRNMGCTIIKVRFNFHLIMFSLSQALALDIVLGARSKLLPTIATGMHSLFRFMYYA